MEHKEPSADDMINDPNVIKFIPDTNVLLALSNPKNQFHLEAKTALDALNHKQQVYIVASYIVLGEFIAHRNLLPRGKQSVKAALEIFEKLGKKFTRTFSGGPPLHMRVVIGLYMKHSRHRAFSSAGFADFLLLTQAEQMKNGRVLTCDKNMYLCGKSILKNNIYYLPNNSDIKSDFTRLISEIQNDFKPRRNSKKTTS